MASIYRRGQQWVIAYKDPESEKIRVRSLKTKDEAEARQLQKEFEVELAKGTHQHRGQKTIESYWSEYLRDTSHRKKTTNYCEQRIIQKFLKRSGKKMLSSLNKDDVLRFLQSGKESAPKTFNNALIAIKRYFRPAVERGWIQNNPSDSISLKKVPQAPPKFFTDEEFSRIEETAKAERIYPLILVARYAGLRLRELLNLEWQDFDFEHRLLKVLNKPHFGYSLKSYKVRVVPLSAELIEKLKPYVEKDGLCFKTYANWRRGERYLAGGPQRQLHRIFKRAGIPTDKPIGFHHLRHTFASRLVQNGVPLKKISVWLGHSSVTTTEIYAKINPQYDEDIEKLSLRGKS